MLKSYLLLWICANNIKYSNAIKIFCEIVLLRPFPFANNGFCYNFHIVIY